VDYLPRNQVINTRIICGMKISILGEKMSALGEYAE